jgi:hypothetical protein
MSTLQGTAYVSEADGYIDLVWIDPETGEELDDRIEWDEPDTAEEVAGAVDQALTEAAPWWLQAHRPVWRRTGPIVAREFPVEAEV